MIDFSTLQGLTIPEGVVTKITDASGRVLWMLHVNKHIVLEVAKITSSTYVGSTSYTSEEFILLDIYPHSGGTVTVTYGGLTKTITDDGTSEEPNAQMVFFGTYGGVSDEVETPSSGTLIIDGDCVAFGCGSYKSTSKSSTLYYDGITTIVDFGSVSYIPNYAFYSYINNYELSLSKLPDGITSIGAYAFYYCEKVSITEIPEGVETIGAYSFYMNTVKHDNGDSDVSTSLTTMILPSTLTFIGDYAFAYYNKEHYYSSLGDITIMATTPPTIGTNVFGEWVSCNITVPKGCSEVYKAAEGWSAYADYIVEASS